MFAGKEMIERLRLVRAVSAQSVKACQLGGLQERARDGGVRAHQLHQVDVPVDPRWRLDYQVPQAHEAAVLPGSAGSHIAAVNAVDQVLNELVGPFQHIENAVVPGVTEGQAALDAKLQLVLAYQVQARGVLRRSHEQDAQRMARQDRGGRLGKNTTARDRGSQRLQGVKAPRGVREEEIVTEESDKAAVNVAQPLEL